MPEPGHFHRGRHAGLLVPLFSIPSNASWGIGEISDLPRFARWLELAGLDFVQLLPVNEMEGTQHSPYSALSAMAIDPAFISLDRSPEFLASGGLESMSAIDRERLNRARRSRSVDFPEVRAVKDVAFGRAFDVFRQRHRDTGDERDRAFEEFARREAWWLDDYALFRALHDEHAGAYWRDWPPALRDRQPTALQEARLRLSARILYYQYLQWLADEQWQRARRECGGVGLIGDFPFMVSANSADVWSRQREFRIDASVGTPPDAFSEEGQDWGLPVYRWEVMEREGYEWLRQRIRRCVELFDGFRIDHLVGFYRTFVRERDGQSFFTPGDEPSQLAQGERLMALFVESGARIIAEDLGLVPDFVRDSLARLDIPGLKVLRWERRWHDEGKPFRRPADYPPESVALSGTHDTETLAEWWDRADLDERRRCAALFGSLEADPAGDSPFSPAVRDRLLELLFGAGSNFLILPVQDVFGWRDRVNLPGVVNDENWTWRLPWLLEELPAQPDAQERARFLRDLSQRYRRC
jgi:4-alpha-glucanotransferase